MAIKRVSDLNVVEITTDLNNKTYSGTSTEATKSLFEISWNINPSSSSGDDNKFESKAITLDALSSVITYPILYRDLTIAGKKTFTDDLTTNNVTINGNVSLSGGNVSITTGNGKTITINTPTLTLNVTTINNNATAYNIKSTNTELSSSTMIKATAPTILLETSGNQIEVKNENNGITITYKDKLTIKYVNGSTNKTMLEFSGDNVKAYGKWNFANSSATQPLSGYINHALYS